MGILEEIKNEIKKLESKNDKFQPQIEVLKYFKEQFEMAQKL